MSRDDWFALNGFNNCLLNAGMNGCKKEASKQRALAGDFTRVSHLGPGESPCPLSLQPSLYLMKLYRLPKHNFKS